MQEDNTFLVCRIELSQIWQPGGRLLAACIHRQREHAAFSSGWLLKFSEPPHYLIAGIARERR